ncbi:MAG: putative DNA-binding domain-containing protein [Gammaproteobacteria bacterium]|nr:putative DNA-binding domain-containing protein [Gammaproteobacteria bacterium]
MQPETDFKACQYSFANYIRNPESVELNNFKDIEPRRMKIYAELFYNNIESFISNNFPVFKSITKDDIWDQLIRSFMKIHKCQTPIFTEIAKEFIQFIQSEQFQALDLSTKIYDFSLELLWYEYIELILSIDKDSIEWPLFDSNFESYENIISNKPQVSPLSQLCQFSYPVHKICTDFIPDETQKEDCFILIYRDREHQINFIQMSVMSNYLFQKIADNENQTTKQILNNLCDEMNYEDKSSFIDAGLGLLSDWYEKDILFSKGDIDE